MQDRARGRCKLLGPQWCPLCCSSFTRWGAIYLGLLFQDRATEVTATACCFASPLSYVLPCSMYGDLLTAPRVLLPGAACSTENAACVAAAPVFVSQTVLNLSFDRPASFPRSKSQYGGVYIDNGERKRFHHSPEAKGRQLKTSSPAAADRMSCSSTEPRVVRNDGCAARIPPSSFVIWLKPFDVSISITGMQMLNATVP